MRTLASIGLVLVLSVLAAAPAFPLSYEIDVGGNGTFETGEVVNLFCDGGTGIIDLYVDGYACPPDDKMFGVQTYIRTDANYASIDFCHPFFGPFDPSLSECREVDDYEQVYALIVGNFDFVTVAGGRQKIATVQVTVGGVAEAPLVLADDLTSYNLPAYNDGYLVDCNYLTLHPDDATAVLSNYIAFCYAVVTPHSASVNSGESIQFYAQGMCCSSPPSYLWSDDCAYGNVDQEGLFTADVACFSETCQVCATDTANNGAGGETVRDCADVEIVAACCADCNGDNKVDLNDLVIMKGEFLRDDCATNPCQADCNGDDKVDLSDLVIMKDQFLRTDCPV
jgi:hypothetical protein